MEIRDGTVGRWSQTTLSRSIQLKVVIEHTCSLTSGSPPSCSSSSKSKSECECESASASARTGANAFASESARASCEKRREKVVAEGQVR